jgi:hypothetical protein
MVRSFFSGVCRVSLGLLFANFRSVLGNGLRILSSFLGTKSVQCK